MGRGKISQHSAVSGAHCCPISYCPGLPSVPFHAVGHPPQPGCFYLHVRRNKKDWRRGLQVWPGVPSLIPSLLHMLAFPAALFPSTGCCTLALRNPQGPVMVSLEACGCTEGPLGTGHLDKCVNRIPSLPCTPFESPITLPFSPGILQSLRFPCVCTCSRMASLALCRARSLSAAFFGLVIGKGRCLFLWQHDSPRESGVCQVGWER